MNFYKNKTYQRKDLRAPYREEVILKSDRNSVILKSIAFNISRGGLLLNHVQNFPEEENSFFLLIKVCRYPFFKNFDFEKLSSYSKDLLKAKIVKVRCKVVRRQKITNSIDNLTMSNIGLEFLDVAPYDSEAISEYVDVFSSNLIYLQTLIDSLNQKPDKEKYIRELAKILGYDPEIKIALLNKYVIQDYRSLQWL